ncbi:protein FAR1-RELATED SEQUENCE 5-like [Arachis stenosperma]|uniref:protein FAR1-RELATED SEQUENCE 5-like n=1 Tax=Arachis stenosperma TaxID=217475 RepID=UPI0025ACD2BB|nr:protein FAR1-RELATED SEQUENCE 5-like [Arachis stenosperma]
MNGFSARKSQIRCNVNNDVTQQAFVCFRQGFRDLCSDNDATRRKQEPKPTTRCGCGVEMRVHIHEETGRWIVTYFQEEHNHEMLDDMLTFMLPGHGKMNSAAIDQMNMMLKIGIKTPQIYSSLVHTADDEGRLVHLFWSDNCSQLDYHLFGDVVAFDATYRTNKYMCPLVVFSGVNHHNQTIVFAHALVANENKATYTWLLEQFLDAMKGKKHGCVITDGHGAMKKAIETVFAGAYHCLCAWHLIRNATSNLSNPTFTFEFKKCMIFYYEVSEFEEKWENLVSSLGLHDNEWIFQCISQIRSREAQSDLQSIVGDLVLQSPLHDLERSAAKMLTREIFLLFRSMLLRACSLKIRSCTYTPTFEIYTLSYSRSLHKEWRTSHYPNEEIYKCSCMRLESLGIPCDHVVAVLVHLDAIELPKSLILDRELCLLGSAGDTEFSELTDKFRNEIILLKE